MANQNRFSRCSTIDQVADLYESLMSPENLHCDGEISATDASRKAQSINADYRARIVEIARGN